MMPNQGDSVAALDALRAQQVKADSSGAVDQPALDLTAAFQKHAKDQHAEAQSSEDAAKADAQSHMDAFTKGAGDAAKLRKSVDEYNTAKMRRQFFEDHYGVKPVGTSTTPEGASTPGSMPGPQTLPPTTNTQSGY